MSGLSQFSATWNLDDTSLRPAHRWSRVSRDTRRPNPLVCWRFCIQFGSNYLSGLHGRRCCCCSMHFTASNYWSIIRALRSYSDIEVPVRERYYHGSGRPRNLNNAETRISMASIILLHSSNNFVLLYLCCICVLPPTHLGQDCDRGGDYN